MSGKNVGQQATWGSQISEKVNKSVDDIYQNLGRPEVEKQSLGFSCTLKGRWHLVFPLLAPQIASKSIRLIDLGQSFFADRSPRHNCHTTPLSLPWSVFWLENQLCSRRLQWALEYIRQTGGLSASKSINNEFPLNFGEGSPSTIKFEYLNGDNGPAAKGEVRAEVIVLPSFPSCAQIIILWPIVRACCETRE